MQITIKETLKEEKKETIISAIKYYTDMLQADIVFDIATKSLCAYKNNQRIFIVDFNGSVKYIEPSFDSSQTREIIEEVADAIRFNFGGPIMFVKAALKDIVLFKWLIQTQNAENLNSIDKDLDFLIQTIEDKYAKTQLIEAQEYLVERVLQLKNEKKVTVQAQFLVKYQ